MTTLDDTPATLTAPPDATGRFGEFGGRFVPETLVPACQELEAGFREAWSDPGFRTELATTLRDYAGRPSMLTECFRLGDELGAVLDVGPAAFGAGVFRTTDRIAREIVETYVLSKTKLPWYIDLLNINLNNHDLKLAKQRISQYMEDFKKEGTRITENLDTLPA